MNEYCTSTTRYGMVWFEVVWCDSYFDDYRCLLVWFGCDLVRIHSVWFVSLLFRSTWVYLVWFGVVWCHLYCNNWCSLVWVGCGLVRNHLVWFGRNWFDFVWFGVICNRLTIIDLIWLDFGVVWCGLVIGRTRLLWLKTTPLDEA